MAIDWGRMARGVATGYLSAKIANTEANDALNARIIEAAGLKFHEKTYPEWEKKQELYEKDYKMVEAIHGKQVANYFGEKDLFGTGNGLNDVEAILSKYNIKKGELNKLNLSTFEDRKASRLEDIQSKERQIMELTTGSSKIGPSTIKNQLEGFGEGTGTATETQPSNVEGTPIVPVQPDISTSVSTDLPESIFTKKADPRGVESKFKQIPIAINEKYGYGENIKMEDGTYKFQPTGTMAKTANAHIALAEIISSQDNSINQYGAADQAKNMLVNLTEMPFISLEQTLGGKYEAGDGSKTALISGVGTINANEIQYNGQSVSEYLVDFVINQIPVDGRGNINKAVIDKFIENIPSNLMYSKDESMAERLDRKVKETNFFNTFG